MDDPKQTEADETTARAGRCAIVGRPNVGKSTLLNTLLGQKLVIATPTPGTTRSCVLAVYATEAPPTQIAFVDTPGMGQGGTALGRILSEEAKEGLGATDVVVLLTDVSPRMRSPRVHPRDEGVIALLRSCAQPVILAINKVDQLADKRLLLPLMQLYGERMEFAAMVPLSALTGVGMEALVGEIRQRLPEGRLYDDAFLTDRPERFFVAELIREAVLTHTRAEVPHGSAVWIDDWIDEGALTRVAATVVVEKQSHKKIVIGARGERMKAIGTQARLEAERMLGRKVFLKLWVKVVPGWTADPAKARRMLSEEGP
jgi:GTPase